MSGAAPMGKEMNNPKKPSRLITTMVRADRVRLSCLFISKEATRYYLNGVHFVPIKGGVRLEATDGHRLSFFRDDGWCGHDMIVSIPSAALAAMRDPKMVRLTKKRWAASVQYTAWFGIVGEPGTRAAMARVYWGPEDRDEAEVAMSDPLNEGILWQGRVGIIDGTYPDAPAVIPKHCIQNGGAAGFQSRYLTDFGKVAGRLSAPIRVYTSNATDPALIDCGRDDFVGVIMPMRMSDRPNALLVNESNVVAPDWAAQPALPLSPARAA